MAGLVVGMKVRYLPQPEWGVGHVMALVEEGSQAEVLFPGRGQDAVRVSLRGRALVPHTLVAGDLFVTPKGRHGKVTGEEPGARGLRRYVVRFDDGEDDELPESEVRAVPPASDLLATLREGRVGDAKGFELRRRVLHLDDERRNDALGALFASRVMVKPHQVGVVQRVLSARRPRFVLADEVGLGKTIEAGMVFSALRLAGLARRVLVVAPSHLTVQWLVELFHKFNQLFTLMDGDRYASSKKEQPESSPWARFPLVVTSLELLARSPEHLREATAPDAAWDLVVMDEAHHLKSDRAFTAAQALAKSSWGLLLLTATPMQLDPEEYRKLLTLIDAEAAPTREAFDARRQRQEELSSAVRALLDGKATADTLAPLVKRFPDDPVLKVPKGQAPDREALLAHLSETYSLSDHLLRNRRAVVGGFSERKLHRHRVALPEPERAARQAAFESLRVAVQAGGGVHGAVLSNLLRRLDSSPAAFNAALRSTQALASLDSSVEVPSRDAKLLAFQKLLASVWEKERGAKVLVFTEARETLEFLQEALRDVQVEALGYHGELPLVERDRQVARFRDPEGPKVLICTEVGGEGRNFQFAHHLVCYDLPWSPAVVEQRIGRLDRIGQTHPVEIHVFDVQGTFASDVLHLLADAVGVFGDTVGGLDAVLEEVEPRLAELALAPPEQRVAYAEALAKKVGAARAQVRKAYDPLLDVRSFDRVAVEALVARAAERLGLEEVAEGSLEEGLWSIARDLDERLEEAVTELAKKVGIGVDTDEQVEAFQCAFHFGHALNVEALPGISIFEDRTVLGTFWRDSAVEQEEIEYFATGHPIVEALFGFLRDGPFGRSGMRFLEHRRAPKAHGIECLFHLQPPEPQDTSPGARVPSRQLARYLERWLVRVAVSRDAHGKPHADPKLLPFLDDAGRPLKGDEAKSAFPGFGQWIDGGLAEATHAAEAELERLKGDARKAIATERDEALARLERALRHQEVSAKLRDQRLDQERSHYSALLAALDAVRLTLDSICGFVLNR